MTDQLPHFLCERLLGQLDCLIEAGLNTERIKTSETYLTEDAAGCGFSVLRDLDALRLRRHLRSLLDARTGKPTSAATYNWHSKLWTAFGWWLCAKRLEGNRPMMTGDKRLGSNPFDGFGTKNEQADRRPKARALIDDELTRLIDAATAGTPRG